MIFAYDPSADEVLAQNRRVYSGAVISCGNFQVGQTYYVYVDGEVSGSDTAGIYDVATVTAYDGGTQMTYTGTDVRIHPGGFGGGQKPDDMEPPEGFEPGERPEGMEPPEGMAQGERPEKPEGMVFPEGFEPGGMPEGMAFPGMGNAENGEPNPSFFMQDMVNFFSGLSTV